MASSLRIGEYVITIDLETKGAKKRILPDSPTEQRMRTEKANRIIRFRRSIFEPDDEIRLKMIEDIK